MILIASQIVILYFCTNDVDLVFVYRIDGRVIYKIICSLFLRVNEDALHRNIKIIGEALARYIFNFTGKVSIDQQVIQLSPKLFIPTPNTE